MSLFGRKKKKEEYKEEESEEPEEEEPYTYDTEVTCKNCNNENSFDIEVGTTVEEFIKNKKCEHCECNLIRQEEK